MKVNNHSIIIICLLICGLIATAAWAGATKIADDFSNLNGWTGNTATWSVANNIAKVSSDGIGIISTTTLNGGTGAKGSIEFEFMYNPRTSGGITVWIGSDYSVTPVTTISYNMYANSVIINWYNGAYHTISTATYTSWVSGTWYHAKINFTGNTYNVYIDNTKIGTYTGYTPTDTYHLKLNNGNNVYMNIKNFRATDEGQDYVTIAPDTISYQGTISEYSTQKYAGTFSLSVWRQEGTTNQTSVQYVTSDGTGHSGVDYGQTSGTLTWGTGEIYKTITVPIYNADPTQARTFYVNLSNVQNGVLVDPKSAHVTVAAAGAYAVQVVPDPVTIMNTVQATLTINDPTYQYNQIVWQLDGTVVDTFTLSGASQWQRWNGTGYANVANATVFQRSDMITSSGIHKYFVLVTNNGAQRGYAEQFFNCTSTGQGQTMIRVQAVDGSNPDSVIQTVVATAFEQENLSAPATHWTDGDHILMATMYHHYTVTLAANGYQNTTYTVYADQMAGNVSSAKIIKIPMYNTQQPTNASNSFVNVMVKSDVTGDPIADIVVKFTRSDGSSKVKYTNSAGTLSTPFEEAKGSTITCTVSSSSYMSQTSTFTVPSEYSTLYFRLPYKPSPTPTVTAAPTDDGSDGSGGSSNNNPVLTPGQRTAKANRMLDMLSNYGEVMLYLVIIVVIISLFGKMGGK